jgi:hypothetical protein
MDTEYTYNLTAEQVQTISTALDSAGKTTQEQIDAYRSAGGALALGWWNNPELARESPEGAQFGYELILGMADLPTAAQDVQVIMEPGDAGEVLKMDSEVVYAPAERPRLSDEVFWDIESRLLERYGLSMSDIEFYYSY